MSQPEFKRIVTPQEAAWPAHKLVGLLVVTLAAALFILKTLAGRMGY
jgi:hypothetical protein